MIEENSGLAKSVPLSEVSHLESVPLARFYCIKKSLVSISQLVLACRNTICLNQILAILGHHQLRMNLPYEGLKENSICCNNKYIFVRGGSSVTNELIHVYR